MAQQQQSKPTVYQRLSKLFGTGGQPEVQKQPSISAKELLTATSAEELMLKRLEAQQSQYLGNQFEKLTSNLYQQTVYYETTRLASYGDFEAMEFSIIGSTLIPTPNGFITIKELAEKGRDYEFIVYSYDHNKKCVVPARAKNAHYTRDEMTYKIIFDNDSYIIATYGHRFLKRDGIFCKVEDLKEGDSMMPFYQTDDEIYSCNDEIGWMDKLDLNLDFEKCDLNNKINIAWDDLINELENIHKKYEKEELYWHEQFVDINLARKFNVSIFDLDCFIKQNGYKDWDTLLKAYNISNKHLELDSELINHKIKKIEPYKVVPVYDLSVPGYKNFATDTIFSHNTPEISASLDLISEESCTLNEFGKMLQVFSNSRRIKTVLENLFNNTLDININLPAWVRNCAKFGDNFVYLKSEIGKGIVGVKQLPNIEIRREESSITDQKNVVRFIWQGKSMEFTAWQVAHFRLLGDDRHLPYGTCIKYDTRIETENGYKEIKNIKIGDSVWSFDIKTQKRILSPVLDTVRSGKKVCYRLSTKHNFIDASKEHKILYYNKEKENFDYKNVLEFKIGDLLVINQKINTNNNVEINKIKPIETKRLNNKNGYWNKINSIPDYVDEDFASLFGFMLGDGWITGNQNFIALGEHETLNTKYTNLLKKFSGNEHITYVKSFYGDNKNEYSQALSTSKMLKTILKRMKFEGNAYTKRIPEWVYSANKKIRESFLNGLYDADGSIFIDKWNCARYNLELANEQLIKDTKILVQSLGYKSGKIGNRLRKERPFFGNRQIKNINRSYYFYYFKTNLNQTKINDIKNRKTNEYILEPITSIKEIGEYDTYDIYVENKNHNFYANGIVVHNSFLEKARKIWKQLVLCLAKDTKIWTTDGYKEIQNIKEGEIVYSFDYITNKLVKSKVKKCWKTSDSREIYKIKTRYNEIKLTDNHPILVSNGKIITYKNINQIDLKKDKIFITPTFYEIKGTEKILSITKENNDEVWDLEVDNDLHNFIANGIVVHNSEDAMLVYRISRAAERRVFKIDVGNMDDKDVEAHIQKVAQKLGKRTPQAENTGNFTSQVDVRFNTLSLEQDYFLPTRAGGGTTEITTLEGASNLDQISDIEYIQRKLFTAMRIPKAFLGFEEAIGEGKNLALQDIRFARTINRIQQSMIQELNKIAIIHLYMLGFEEELDNFSLSLNSPSTQAEMLKIEQWKEKILLYRDMVSDAGNGFAATSMTWAKRNILNFSDDEINLDLNQQRIEKAAGKENEAPEQIIHTGLFDKLDKRYQKKEGEELPEASPEEGAPGEIPGLGGGPEMGGPGGEELPPIAAAGGPEGGGEMPELKEEKLQLLESKYKILDDNSKVLHEDLKGMLEEIDNVLNEGKEISIKKIINENEELKN